MRRTLILSVILALCLNLALEAKTSKAKQLQKNLQQWEQFRWEGIIQVSMSAFSLRKDFVLAKTPNEMRLDVLDSGLMGLQAKPIAVFYLKDKILVDAPSVARLKDVDLNWFVPQGTVPVFVHFSDSLQAHKADILAHRKISTANTTFFFDKKYRLNKVQSTEFGMLASVVYNRRSEPTKLTLEHTGSRIVELQINNHNYKEIHIEALKSGPEPPEPAELKDITPLDKLKLNLLELDQLDLPELLDSLKLTGISLRGLVDTLEIGSLKLKDFDLGILNLGGVQLDLRRYEDQSLDTMLDSLHLGDIKVEKMLDDLDLEQVKVKELLGRLREVNRNPALPDGDPNGQNPAADSLNLGKLDLQNLLKGQNLQGLDLQKMLQVLNLNGADLQKMLEGMNLQGQGTEGLDLQKMLQGLNLNEADLQKMLQGLDLNNLDLQGLGQETK